MIKNSENNGAVKHVRADEQEGEIFTLKNILFFINKAYIRIIIYVFAAIIIATICVTAVHSIKARKKGYAASMLEFDYPGIVLGLDPSGQRLDVSIIKSSNIINMALAELDLGMDAKTVAQAITVSPIIPKDIVEKYENISKLVDEDFSNLVLLDDINYFPTKYKIEFSNNAVSADKARQFLDKLIGQYKKYFSDRFYTMIGYNCNLINAEAIAAYDFTDMIDVYEKQIGKFDTYISGLNISNKNDKAFETNLSLSEISLQASAMKNYDLIAIKNYVEIYSVTKQNYGKYKELLRNKKRLTQSEINVLNANIKSVEDALFEYKKNKIVIFSSEKGEPIEIASPTMQYDYFHSELIRLETAIAYNSEKIIEIDFTLDKLKDIDDSKSSNESDIEAVNKLFSELNEKYNDIAQKAETAIYYYYNDTYMASTVRSVILVNDMTIIKNFFSVDTILILLAAVFVGLGTAIIETGFRLKKRKNKKSLEDT